MYGLFQMRVMFVLRCVKMGGACGTRAARSMDHAAKISADQSRSCINRHEDDSEKGGNALTT